MPKYFKHLAIKYATLDTFIFRWVGKGFDKNVNLTFCVLCGNLDMEQATYPSSSLYYVKVLSVKYLIILFKYIFLAIY